MKRPDPPRLVMQLAVGEGAVVGARSSVFRDVAPWTVVAGSPVKFIMERVLDRVTGLGQNSGDRRA